MRRSHLQTVIVVLTVLLLVAVLPLGSPVAAVELPPTEGSQDYVSNIPGVISEDWKLKNFVSDLGQPDGVHFPRIAAGFSGPVIAFWRIDNHELVVARKQGDKWLDLKAQISCSWGDTHVDMALAVDQIDEDIHLAYVCIGTFYDDLRYSRYDNAKQEWMTESVDKAPLWGFIRGLSMVDSKSGQAYLSYVVGTELRHARRMGPGNWVVTTVATSSASIEGFLDTAVGEPKSLGDSLSVAYTYKKDGKNYVAQAVFDKSAWRSTTVAEGEVIQNSSRDCLAFRDRSDLFYAYKRTSGDWTYDKVIDRSSGQKIFGGWCHSPYFVFDRNDGVVLAALGTGTTVWGIKRIIADNRGGLKDSAVSVESTAVYLLLDDNRPGYETNWYYSSGMLGTFSFANKARIRPEGAKISKNNDPVPDGANAPFVEGDRVVAYPPSVKKISFNSECAKGFVEIVALQTRPHLPKKYQYLSNTEIAFMILLSNPKLQHLLEEVCKENSTDVAIAEEAKIEEATVEEPYLLLDMENGAIQMTPHHADFILDIRTPQATCRTTGGSTATIAHDTDSNSSFIHVTQGTAIVTPADTQVPPFTLKAGKAAEITPTGVKKQNIASPLYLPYIGG